MYKIGKEYKMNGHEINVTHGIHARSFNIGYKGLVHNIR